MRAFIAIELPKEIKEALAKLQELLKKTGADVKWVEPQNIHLTLKFLGEINETQFDKIITALTETAQNFAPFDIRISSLGAFPKIIYPRVIWVGVDKGDNESGKIASWLEEKIGIPKETRDFSSHITIGRVRSPKNKADLIKDMENLKDYFGRINTEFKVTKISLFKSSLSPKGPTYEILKEVNLKTS